MALKIETVAHACRLISQEIKDAYKNLTIHYIVHHEGQRTEALSMAAQELVLHPAASTALHILQRPRLSEDSTLLGTAVARQNMFFGLVTTDRLLSLCTMNIDQFDTLKEARRHAYHLAWHAIDALTYHSNPDNRTGAASEIIIRRRNALEMAGANLQADTFSAVVARLAGDREAINRMAITRALNPLKACSLQSPEYFPFAIAADATKHAYENFKARPQSKKKMLPAAHRLGVRVTKTFDEQPLEHWLAFSEGAQDMAWRGFKQEEILSAAINTSPDTYVRATGYLVSEITGIKPSPLAEIENHYSPFADDAFNSERHARKASQIFEDVIAQGLKENSHIPFLRMASRQNEDLTEGRVMGWCAGALHAAARAFDSAVKHGGEAEIVARREFESEQKKINWQDLNALGQEIVGQKRKGHIVTMKQIAEIGHNIENISSIQKSIEMSMKDPTYQQKLSAAQELSPATPRISPIPARPARPVATAEPETPAREMEVEAAATAVPLAGPGGMTFGGSRSRPSSPSGAQSQTRARPEKTETSAAQKPSEEKRENPQDSTQQ